MRRYYIYFYILSAFFFIFSILSFFLNQNQNRYLKIIFLSSVFTLYMFEFYLAFNIGKKINNFKKKKEYYNITKKEYDFRDGYQFFLHKKEKEKNIKFYVQPDNFLNSESQNIFPLAGLSYSKTIHCNENGYYSIYKSDRYGFNNSDDKIWDKDEIDFVLVGDSFVHGACVNPKDTFSENLKNLSGKNVLNLGYGGNGSLIEYATLKEYSPKYPKNILWFYFEENDIKELSKEINNPLLKKYLSNDSYKQNLKIKQSIIDLKIEKWIEKKVKAKNIRKKDFKNQKTDQWWFFFNNKLFSIAKLWNTRHAIFFSHKNQVIENNSMSTNDFEKIIKKLKKFSLEKESKVYFVYLPGYWRYKYDIVPENYFPIIKIVQENGIKVIDVNDIFFKDTKNPLSFFPFRQFGHYNENGYKIIMTKIYNEILKDRNK